MNFTGTLGKALIGVLALVGVIAYFRSTSSAELPADLQKAMAEAKKERKLVMVDFSASWCGPCQQYKQEVFPSTAFRDATKDIKLVTVDIDAQRGVASKFGVDGIPDIRFLSPDGKEVGRLVGFGGAEPLLAELAKARKEANL